MENEINRPPESYPYSTLIHRLQKRRLPEGCLLQKWGVASGSYEMLHVSISNICLDLLACILLNTKEINWRM